jgi:hypothetical protein
VEYREVTQTVGVPKNTGTEGFIVTVRELLKRPRIQEIVINAAGQVTYRRLVSDDEDTPLNVDLETLTPSGVMSRSRVDELTLPPTIPAAISISKMFDRFAIDQVYPIALVSGAATVFWDWFRTTSKSALHSRAYAFGLPFITDRHVPDTALLLFGSTATPRASLIDTTNVLKLEMETSILKVPDTTVEVL